MSVTILCPLAMEARAARRGIRQLSGNVSVLCTGMGPKRSRQAKIPASSAVVVGMGGAVTDSIAPGDVVVATDVVATDVTPIGFAHSEQMAHSLRDAGFVVHTGSIACVAKLAVGVQRQELADMGAIAVDMESAWLMEQHCHPAGVVRVITDTPSHEIRSLNAPARVWRALQTIRLMMPTLVPMLDEEVC